MASTTFTEMDEKILSSIDPLIKELVRKVNQLNFVRKTEYSCSGHWSKQMIRAGYIIIIFRKEPYYLKAIRQFHKKLIIIPGISDNTHRTIIQLMFHKKLLGERIIYRVTPHYIENNNISLKIKELKKRWMLFEKVVDQFLIDNRNR
jgi:transcriptional regulator CtsR